MTTPHDGAPDDPAQASGGRDEGGWDDPAPDAGASDPAGEGIRLQKVLAAAGIGSRRACEELIGAGRVEVDGKIVHEQGRRVHPESAVIRVDGQRVNVVPGRIYLALNKPRGVISAMSDPEGRPTLADYLHTRKHRLFHVGRLDADTEGLILLTNDGELAHRLTHPSFGVLKTYLAEVQGPVPRGIGRRLREGVQLEDGMGFADSFRLVSQLGDRAMVEIVVHEGRKHIVRRMLEEVGLPVRQLARTRLGPVPLGDLKSGRTRDLGRAEVAGLYALVGM